MKDNYSSEVVRLYVDRWNDLWVTWGEYLLRLADNNIGGWFNGEQLTEISFKQYLELNHER